MNSRCRLFFSVGCLVASVAQVSHAAPPARSLSDFSGPWQLFVDDYLIAGKDGVTRTYHAFKKYSGNPILVVDKPWEHNVVSCAAVLPNENGPGYRMWYHCWTRKNDPDHGHALYATSVDGIHWEKPNLGLTEWKVNGSKDNNIIGAAGSIMHTPEDPDPARRYKSISAGEFRFKCSPDGIHWEQLSKDSIFRAGDTGHLTWDPLAGKYRGYAKVNANVRGLRRRAVGYSEGTGFESWPPVHLIMAPDDVDDRWVKPNTVQRAHFYNCPVMRYQTAYLGFLHLYRADDEEEGYFHGPIFVELVTSRDGVHWLREEGDRPPMLERGPEKTFDHGMLFASCIVPVGDQLRLYYSGYDGSHDYLPFHSAVGLATLRKDGFVSLDGGDTPGEFTTKRLKGLHGKLHVNCEAGAGLLQVEVLDADGRVLPGYRKGDCNEPRGDGVDQVVTWDEHEELPAGSEPLRLRFFLKNVSLYSFYAGDTIEVIDEPSPPMLQALFTFEGGDAMADKLPADGAQVLRRLGTTRLAGDPADVAFGKRAILIGSPWRPLHRLQIAATSHLGTQFTLAVMAKSSDNNHARLFSAYNGNKPVNTSELVFDADPTGKAIPGLRLICKGIPVTSKPLAFADNKYHHLAVTYDDGHVRFYFDGEDAGEAWLPGGAPVSLARDLLVAEDAEMGSEPHQFLGHMDDILVLGRALEREEIASLHKNGAEAFFHRWRSAKRK
jgi:hypothetical protein